MAQKRLYNQVKKRNMKQARSQTTKFGKIDRDYYDGRLEVSNADALDRHDPTMFRRNAVVKRRSQIGK